MPEFEESESTPSPKLNYSPSTDATAKPRTRRRSGGFKTEHAAPNTSIGEVNPADALKSEKLSGGSKPAAPKAEKTKVMPEKPDAARAEEPVLTGHAQPSPETLAAIQRVEVRLAERKTARDAKRAERERNRPAKAEKASAPAKKAPRPKKNPRKSGGLLASILSWFGLGPKQAARKPKGKGGHRGQGNGNGRGGRPQGKGGHRGQGGGNGQNRRGGNRGSKGRRRGGKGPRRSDRPGNETLS